jgi:murein DD-endopeptidase MepM/ murein hydrolase activator NlpD
LPVFLAAFFPFTVEASFFSSLRAALLPQTAAASSTSVNVQTIRLLEPALNIDPNPAKGGGDITVVDGSALLPETGPSGTIADIIDKPTTSQISVYVVHKGDSLSEIATMFDVSVNTIVWANDIGKEGVHEGQTLVILPITGVRYKILKGDTVASVAKKFNADAGEIRDYNGLGDGGLTVGETIIIPDGEVARAVAAAPAKKTTVKAKVTTNPFRGGSGEDMHTYYIWPTAGGLVTQGLHGYNGIDIGAPKGTEIYAAAPGTVIIARSGGWNGGYGSYVVIAHDNGTQTLYGHMSKVAAQVGERVSQGDLIGYVGATGKATGNHLHFEVRGAKNPFTTIGMTH